MSVCMFSRPTSCRPCLTSSIALSYRILSGCALLSTLVDLLTFFFLWRIWVICASLLVAPSKNSAPRTQSARPFLVKYGFEVAQLTVRPKLHLSRESRVLRRNPRLNPGFLDVPALREAATTKYTLNQRPGGARTLPFRTGHAHPTPPSVMHSFNSKGCLNFLPLFIYFQRNVTMSRPTLATIRRSRFRGAAAARPPT
jgi:hypothetical protein